MNKGMICTICARGGSKGVKNKNIRELHGRPLIAHTITQALDSGLFDHVIVSTDSDAIIDISIKYGAEVLFKRPMELATDSAGKLSVIRHAFLYCEEYYKTKYLNHIDLDATSPLRSIEDIHNAFNKFKENNYSTLITGSPARRSPYFNLVEMDSSGKVSLSKKLGNAVIRRQDAPLSYDMNASIYIWDRTTLLEQDTLFTDNTGIYVMPEERSFDIDSELDFKIVSLLMEDQYAR